MGNENGPRRVPGWLEQARGTYSPVRPCLSRSRHVEVGPSAFMRAGRPGRSTLHNSFPRLRQWRVLGDGGWHAVVRLGLRPLDGFHRLDHLESPACLRPLDLLARRTDGIAVGIELRFGRLAILEALGEVGGPDPLRIEGLDG